MLLEEIRENTTKYIKSIAMDIVVIIVALAYILYQMVSLETTNLNPLVLIAEAIVGIICGVIIKQALGENGFSKGYNSKIWVEEEEKYNSACDTAIPYIERVDNFYLYLEKEKRENYRRNHLSSVRLKYSNWFDENGDYIGKEEDFKKLRLYQKAMVKWCIRVKIYVLNLLSEYSTSSEQDTKRENTDKIQRAKNITRNSISAIVIAMIGVYFVPVFTTWSWASLISSTMQVSLWVLFGIVQLYSNYNFIVKDKVSTMRKKKELIAKFVKGCEQGLYLHSPYYEEQKVKEDNSCPVENKVFGTTMVDLNKA